MKFVRKIRIKKANLPFLTECKLIQRAGWVLIERADGYVYLGKPEDWRLRVTANEERVAKMRSVSENLDDPFEDISDARKAYLNGRCQKIVDCFVDPYSHSKNIQKQIHNFGQSLKSEEQEYVINWAHQYVL